MSEKLAKEVWLRVKPFVESDERIANLRPFGFNSWGKWRPCGVNPLFRFVSILYPLPVLVPGILQSATL
jgi:hypothetical protein